jgi:hypothetical protein
MSSLSSIADHKTGHNLRIVHTRILLSAVVIGHDKHNKLVQLIGRETTQAMNHVSLIRPNGKENSIDIFLSLQQYKASVVIMSVNPFSIEQIWGAMP